MARDYEAAPHRQRPNPFQSLDRGNAAIYPADVVPLSASIFPTTHLLVS